VNERGRLNKETVTTIRGKLKGKWCFVFCLDECHCLSCGRNGKIGFDHVARYYKNAWWKFSLPSSPVQSGKSEDCALPTVSLFAYQTVLLT
jgi:hypothetical protein